jgi:hypothetical protein
MSKKDEYLAHATAARVMADYVSDHITREGLLRAVDYWRLLAELEAHPQRPTRWDPGEPVPANDAVPKRVGD